MKTYIFKDGYKMTMISPKEAKEIFDDNQELFIVNEEDESDRIVDTQEGFDGIAFNEFFAIELKTNQ